MNILQERDMVLAAVILLLAATTFGISRYIRRAPAVVARVSVDGTVVETLDLSKDAEMTVTSSSGGTNHLIVKGGEIRCNGVSCPDEICVRQGKKRLNSDTIMCLPNQTVIAITGGE